MPQSQSRYPKRPHAETPAQLLGMTEEEFDKRIYEHCDKVAMTILKNTILDVTSKKVTISDQTTFEELKIDEFLKSRILEIAEHEAREAQVGWRRFIPVESSTSVLTIAQAKQYVLARSSVA